MADLNLRKGDRILVEMTVARGTPDAEGNIYCRVEGYDVWFPLDKIHSKVYIPIDEPQTIGSVVRTSLGTRYTRYRDSPLHSWPWISDDGTGACSWAEIEGGKPELVK